MARYFREQWGTHVSRENTRDQEQASASADAVDAPSDACAKAVKPEIWDCQQIELPTGNHMINLDYCYTSGNHKWYDLYSFETCQLSVGWDTTQGNPNIFHSDLKALMDTGLSKKESNGCVSYVEDNPDVCVQKGDRPTFVMLGGREP